jgi:hypothetical protein
MRPLHILRPAQRPCSIYRIFIHVHVHESYFHFFVVVVSKCCFGHRLFIQGGSMFCYPMCSSTYGVCVCLCAIIPQNANSSFRSGFKFRRRHSCFGFAPASAWFCRRWPDLKFFICIPSSSILYILHFLSSGLHLWTFHMYTRLPSACMHTYHIHMDVTFPLHRTMIDLDTSARTYYLFYT